MKAHGALRLGIALRPGEGSGGWARALAWVERAEALGLHSVWVPEGHFQRGAVSAPLVALSAFAARTQRLRLGTTSLLLPIHHPRRVAAEVTALLGESAARAGGDGGGADGTPAGERGAPGRGRAEGGNSGGEEEPILTDKTSTIHGKTHR